MFGSSLIFAAIAGVILGGFYFGSLWWVVRRVASRQRPEWLLLASFVLRSAIVLAGFLLVMDGRWDRILACLAGFLLSRTVLVYMIRPDRARTELTQG